MFIPCLKYLVIFSAENFTPSVQSFWQAQGFMSKMHFAVNLPMFLQHIQYLNSLQFLLRQCIKEMHLWQQYWTLTGLCPWDPRQTPTQWIKSSPGTPKKTMEGGVWLTGERSRARLRGRAQKSGKGVIVWKMAWEEKRSWKEIESFYNSTVKQICRKNSGMSLKAFNICKIEYKSTWYSHYYLSVLLAT